MKRIAPDQITDRHILGIAKSLHAAPLDVRHLPSAIIAAIIKGDAVLFEFGHDSIAVVSKDDNRLTIDAADFSVFDRKELGRICQQLAAEMACDIVQTTVFDKRLADAIVAIGGKVESYDMTLTLETVL